MQDQENRHLLGRLMMYASQGPSSVHFFLDKIDTLPRRLRTRAVCHAEHNARSELHEYARSESAAPNVHPGPPGNVLEKNFVKKSSCNQYADQASQVTPSYNGLFISYPRLKILTLHPHLSLVVDPHFHRVEPSVTRREHYSFIIHP